jgi:hypothetical protein
VFGEDGALVLFSLIIIVSVPGLIFFLCQVISRSEASHSIVIMSMSLACPPCLTDLPGDDSH